MDRRSLLKYFGLAPLAGLPAAVPQEEPWSWSVRLRRQSIRMKQDGTLVISNGDDSIAIDGNGQITVSS